MKVRLLLIQETVSSGGVERRRLSLAKLLPKDKFEIKLICTQSIGPLADEIRAEGVEVIEIGLLTKIWNVNRYRAVLKVIKAYKPHIIHGAVFEGVLLATIAGSLGRVPVIIAEETSDPQNRSKKASYLLKMLSLLADNVVAIAPNVANYLENTAKISPSKIRLITNGVSQPRQVSLSEVEMLKSTLGISKDNFVIGSVGRLLNDHKRFTDIIKGVSLLNRSSGIKILIVGDGLDKELIEKEAYRMGLSKNLIMAGFHADTAPYYKLMDVFCLASQREGFGLVAAEAMFHELPVIATRVGGLQNVVSDNVTGLLVDANRPDQIAAAVEKLLVAPELLKELGKEGRKRAESEFSSERYVRDVEKMYDALLRQKQII